MVTENIRKRMTWKEFKDKDIGYKVGYIIGNLLMFSFGLVSCLLVYLVPIIRLPFLVFGIIIIITFKINKIIRKKRKRKCH